jgi:transposase-like protein
MAKHRSHSIEFKRQLAQEFLAGETLHGLAKRHDVSRNLIRIWVRSRIFGRYLTADSLLFWLDLSVVTTARIDSPKAGPRLELAPL